MFVIKILTGNVALTQKVADPANVDEAIETLLGEYISENELDQTVNELRTSSTIEVKKEG